MIPQNLVSHTYKYRFIMLMSDFGLFFSSLRQEFIESFFFLSPKVACKNTLSHFKSTMFHKKGSIFFLFFFLQILHYIKETTHSTKDKKYIWFKNIIHLYKYYWEKSHCIWIKTSIINNGFINKQILLD